VEDAAHSWQVKAARAEHAKPTIITNARTQSAEKAAKRKLSGIHFPPPQLSSHVQALHVFPLSGHFNRPKNFLGLP
jgi:hypothetical protein